MEIIFFVLFYLTQDFVHNLSEIGKLASEINRPRIKRLKILRLKFLGVNVFSLSFSLGGPLDCYYILKIEYHECIIQETTMILEVINFLAALHTNFEKFSMS